MVRASVCLAAYNGANFIEAQLDSIVSQLRTDDELIIIDDFSTDDTVSLIHGYLADTRVKFIRNPENLGVNKTFETAIRLAKGEFIVLSDQDDVWLPGRLERMLLELKTTRKMLVTGNFDTMSNGIRKSNDLGVKSSQSSQHLRNVFRIFRKSGYFGCVMAVNCELKKVMLPFPQDVESHDLWIALAANIMRSNCHIDETVLVRTIHGQNLSGRARPILRKLRSRYKLLMHIIELVRRVSTN